jgi:hypothetical protein
MGTARYAGNLDLASLSDSERNARCLARCLIWARDEALLELKDPAAAALIEVAIESLIRTHQLADLNVNELGASTPKLVVSNS